MGPVRHMVRTAPAQYRDLPRTVEHGHGHSRDSSLDPNWSLDNLQRTSTAVMTGGHFVNYTTQSENRHQRQETTTHGHPPRQQAFPLGTREEAQQDNYSSPIGDMFSRAWDRYRDVQQAREVYRRAELDVTTGVEAALQSVSISGTEVTPEHGHLYDARWVNPDSPLRQNPFIQTSEPSYLASTAPRLRHGRSNFHRQLYMSNPFDAIPQDRRDYSSMFGNSDPSDGRSVIDKQPRPEPVAETDLKVDFGCKVCKEQKVDTVCFPCMHACMCHWCAQIWKDSCKLESGRLDKSLWTCPSCRKNITESRRFYI